MLSKENLYLLCAVIAILIAFYFLIDHKITRIVKEEILKIEKKKFKRQKMNELRQQKMAEMMQMKERGGGLNLSPGQIHPHEGDSYMDPLDQHLPLAPIDDDNNDEVPRARLTHDAMGMRDLEDGTR